MGFIAAAEFLQPEGWSMDWVTIESVRFSKKGKARRLSLVTESKLTNGGEVGHCEVLLSKPGLIGMHERPCNLALRANLATAFVEVIGAWLCLSPFHRRHYLFGKKPPAWPKRIGTAWAYLICARAMAHTCALEEVKFERTDSGWVQAGLPPEMGGQVVVLGLPVAGTWGSVTFALSPTSPHVGQCAPGVTAV